LFFVCDAIEFFSTNKVDYKTYLFRVAAKSWIAMMQIKHVKVRKHV